MYYNLIKLVLISKGLKSFGKSKFYDPETGIIENGNIIYKAIEVFLSCIDRKIHMTILPTFYVEKAMDNLLINYTYRRLLIFIFQNCIILMLVIA